MTIVFALILIMLVVEVFTSLLSLYGLTLFGRRWLPLTCTLLVLLGWLAVGQLIVLSWITLAVIVVLGLLSFATLVTWRRRKLGPELLFAPGERSGRRVQEVFIPRHDYPLPAVLIQPVTEADAAVLVIHGAGDHKTHFTWPLLHTLVDAHFAACAIDVDGHGDNQRGLDFPSVLDNVSVAVAWLRERYQFVAVVGISQGGCITARAAAEGVEVDAVVLMETPTTLSVTRAVIRSEARIVAHPAAWALHREVGTLALARSWKTAPTRTKLSTVELIKRLDAAGSVGKIKAPLLLVYGGSDAVVPPQQAHHMAHQAPPGTTLMMVPRATHLSLSIDRRVVRQIAVWLQDAASKHTHN